MIDRFIDCLTGDGLRWRCKCLPGWTGIRCEEHPWTCLQRGLFDENKTRLQITPCSWLFGQTWSWTFDCWYWLFYHVENLKTSWGLEWEFQDAFSEPICSFLTFFVWEISKGKVKDCNSFFAVTSVFISSSIFLEVVYVQTQVFYFTIINENRCYCKKRVTVFDFNFG